MPQAAKRTQCAAGHDREASAAAVGQQTRERTHARGGQKSDADGHPGHERTAVEPLDYELRQYLNRRAQREISTQYGYPEATGRDHFQRSRHVVMVTNVTIFINECDWVGLVDFGGVTGASLVAST